MKKNYTTHREAGSIDSSTNKITTGKLCVTLIFSLYSAKHILSTKRISLMMPYFRNKIYGILFYHHLINISFKHPPTPLHIIKP